jgi:hypothetical protein
MSGIVNEDDFLRAKFQGFGITGGGYIICLKRSDEKERSITLCVEMRSHAGSPRLLALGSEGRPEDGPGLDCGAGPAKTPISRWAYVQPPISGIGKARHEAQ